MEFIGIDLGKGKDFISNSLYKVNKDITLEVINSDDTIFIVHEKIRTLEYFKYLKRVKNRQTLYNKLKKLGRR